MGKSFRYWQHLYDEGIIESHVTNLRIQHLKYAFDHKLIKNNEYFRTHIPITYQCHIDYKPCSLMDFAKALKINKSTSQLEMVQSSKIGQHVEIICKVQKVSEDLEPCQIIEENNINQTNTKKKSRKKRKKKKKSLYTLENTNNDLNTEAIEHFKNQYLTNSENSPKQMTTSKHPVKVFVRRATKKYKSDTAGTEPLISSKKKTVRDVFSAILKQYKMERRNQLQS